MPKMHQNTFGGRAPIGPTQEALKLPTRPSRNQGVLLLRGETFQLTGLKTAQPH